MAITSRKSKSIFKTDCYMNSDSILSDFRQEENPK